jgi:SPX domain protein involved in polyphosphate accumulation
MILRDTPLPVLERYELKFTVPWDKVDAMCEFIAPYCQMDKHSSLSGDGFYQVNSLYFDTPEFLFLRNRLNGCENRFNMRVRTYGPKPVLPYFLEVKQKRGDIIRKYRARIKEPDLAKVLEAAVLGESDLVSPGEAENAALFRRLAHTYNAHPVLMTSYRRRAFFSECDDYARVTFDIGLRFKPQSGYLPFDVGEDLAPSDVEGCYDEGTNVVLELKCYSQYVPLWMVDMIRCFDLRRRGFSKYSAGAAQVFHRTKFDDSLMVSPWGDFNKE